MRKVLFETGLIRKIKKLAKKDKSLHSALMNKIREIVESGDVGHYKNLRKPLNEFKRVHIKSYVLLFKYDSRKDKLIFYDFVHHDEAYKE